jgi:hypothetical protein
MFDGLETVPTQALQIWLDPTQAELGLPDARLQEGERLIGANWADPLNGWADFSDLIAEERWTPAPKTLLYFCGPLKHVKPEYDRDRFPAEQLAVVREGLETWLDEMPGLLPNVNLPDDLHACAGQADPLNCQYIRANVQPHDRYVLSKPDHLNYRRLAWHSGYDNMALAGDWIFHGFNIASFEGAVMSGALASHALTAFPPINKITGYQFGRMVGSEGHMPEPGSIPLIH